MKQIRWLCRTCQREWLPGTNAAGANPWHPDDGCPGCRSAAIEEVEYQSAFPGADIPRGSDRFPPLDSVVTLGSPPPAVAQAPPHALIDANETAALAAQWEALGRS